MDYHKSAAIHGAAFYSLAQPIVLILRAKQKLPQGRQFGGKGLIAAD